ncbi:hypothetical protein [Actinomadura rugatobispora]|uniref:Uncharacterized protein n=1 Tax=Actinomadura rugatobispora TaxID=1994 RepID=A0ABW1A953_9ACTN|nr:hypothetical protein GCM10010200_020500 [Actinomadura rugatobispora]
MPVKQDGGALRGGAPRVVWFSSESDPRVVSARSVAADLLREETPAHLVWNPCSGEIIQLVPVTRAGGLLEGTVGHEGRVCVQVMVVGHARDPFTGTLLHGLDTIMGWLDAWGVVRRWPAGPPLPSPQSYHSQRGRRDWARGGHFGASQVPGLHRPDPGGIDIRRVTGPDTPVTALPRQRPIPAQQEPRPVPVGEAPPVGDAPRPVPMRDSPDFVPPQDTPEPVPAGAVPAVAGSVTGGTAGGSAEGSAGTNGSCVAVPLPRRAAPLGAVVSVAQHYPLDPLGNITDPVEPASVPQAKPEDTKAVPLYPRSTPPPRRISAPLATSAPSPSDGAAAPIPAPPPSTGTPVPEPASMRS